MRALVHGLLLPRLAPPAPAPGTTAVDNHTLRQHASTAIEALRTFAELLDAQAAAGAASLATAEQARP